MTLEQLIRGRYTFDQALSMYRSGRISEDTWEGYCYARRNLAYCYSNVGRAEAIRHATRHGLTLPYSDRPEWVEPAASF